ncbi:MAG TPA: hypothetical protein PK858_10915, partial [Saprospiraceae bacterium]|nr:hypothetical protein [Saprospiraceae bacterium]
HEAVTGFGEAKKLPANPSTAIKPHLLAACAANFSEDCSTGRNPPAFLTRNHWAKFLQNSDIFLR